MVKQCKSSGLPEPEFLLIRNVGFRTILPRNVYTQEALRNLGLTDRQIKAVKYVQEKGSITNKEYRELCGLSDEGARLDLNNIIKKKVLKPQGKGRSQKYLLM